MRRPGIAGRENRCLLCESGFFAKFVVTEMLILTARIVDRIRKSWFSSYAQVGSSGERGVCKSFCCDLV